MLVFYATVAPPPEKLDAVIPYGADHGHIYVSWKRPECRDSLCGHVNKYILWYCTVAKSGGCVGMLNHLKYLFVSIIIIVITKN